MRVWYPSGVSATNSCACVARAAASIVSCGALAAPYAMFRAIVSSNRTVSCVTIPTWARRDFSVTSRMSTPSIRIAPAVTS